MKLSDWKKKYDKKHPNNKCIRSISSEELMEIDNFDTEDSDKCRHTNTYGILEKNEETKKIQYLNNIADLQKLIRSAKSVKELSYFELDDEYRKLVDKGYDEQNLSCKCTMS